MRLYDYRHAINPRRVRIFMAEKGMAIPLVEVDLSAGEHFSPEFRAINPRCVVPVLELDDGTVIGETLAICRYLEAIQPDPPLMGRTAREQALVTMWEHRMEIEGCFPAVEALRNSLPAMAENALPGPVAYRQIPELADRSRAQLRVFFDMLNDRLSTSAYIAGDDLTIADITAIATIDFAASLLGERVADQLASLRDWQDRMRARPSMAA